jgi:hypothetical protein
MLYQPPLQSINKRTANHALYTHTHTHTVGAYDIAAVVVGSIELRLLPYESRHSNGPSG